MAPSRSHVNRLEPQNVQGRRAGALFLQNSNTRLIVSSGGPVYGHGTVAVFSGQVGTSFQQQHHTLVVLQKAAHVKHGRILSKPGFLLGTEFK